MTSLDTSCLPVAPFTGAWIEILATDLQAEVESVAPFTGAWIEILTTLVSPTFTWSLPSRERGLKYYHITGISKLSGRSLHGSVD